jgi:hypothetical protein
VTERLISRRTLAVLPVVVAVLLFLSGSAVHSAAGYDLSWWTVDAGGSVYSEAGRYSLGGTVGQPDVAFLHGDQYTLVGGFWGGAPVEYRLLLPLVLRQY